MQQRQIASVPRASDKGSDKGALMKMKTSNGNDMS